MDSRPPNRLRCARAEDTAGCPALRCPWHDWILVHPSKEMQAGRSRLPRAFPTTGVDGVAGTFVPRHAPRLRATSYHYRLTSIVASGLRSHAAR